MSNRLTFKWCATIDDIKPENWVEIYGSDIVKSRGFMKANEVAEFDDVEFRYLQVFRDGNIIAIVPCFSYGMDLINIASSGKGKNLIGKIRKIYPSFLKLPVFVTGSYAATCEHFFKYIPNLTEAEIAEVSNVVDHEIKRMSRKMKTSFVLIKDVRERDLKYVKDILSPDYKFVVSFPTNAIPIIGSVSYPAALRKKNRKRYRIFKDRFDKIFKWEIVTDYGGELAKEFNFLYQKVLAKAKIKFDFLNEKFFEATNGLLAEKSFFLIARDKITEEIRVMIIILENEDSLIPLFMGFRYKDDDSKVLYLNTIFHIVKEAEARGKSYVDFGQMSYYPKAMSGALVENIYYGFWSANPMAKWFINHYIDKMFSAPEVPEHVYLKEYADEAHRILTEKGFVLLN